MLRVEKVATPFTAATVAVPDSVPPLGFTPIATVTLPVNPVAMFPCASCAVTWTAGVIAAPAVVLVGCPVKMSCAAAPGVMLNGILVAPVTPVVLAVTVYPVPLLLMLRVEKVATPFTAATVAVPDSVPPLGFTPIATVTLPVNPVAMFPCASCAVTWTAGVIAAPALVLVGCPVKMSCAAAPGVMLNGILVAPVTPVVLAVTVYPVPLLLMLRVEKVATPFTAATVAVPDSVPPLGFTPIATVTLPVNPVAMFPCASRAVTWTAGVIAAPAVVVLGCTVYTSCTAAPGVMLNAALVAPVRPVALAPRV